MADAGADPFTLAAILGHSDIRMTARYKHATDEAKRRAVDRLVVLSSVETRPLPQAVLTVRDTATIPVETVPMRSFGNDLAPEVKTARNASP
jgi:hypothetical protein